MLSVESSYDPHIDTKKKTMVLRGRHSDSAAYLQTNTPSMYINFTIHKKNREHTHLNNEKKK